MKYDPSTSLMATRATENTNGTYTTVSPKADRKGGEGQKSHKCINYNDHIKVYMGGGGGGPPVPLWGELLPTYTCTCRFSDMITAHHLLLMTVPPPFSRAVS